MVGVAVVGGEQHLAARGQHRADDPARALVHGLDGLDRRLEHAGVAHHVAVGKVQDDDVVFAALDAPHALVGHEVGAHFGLQVVGCHLGAGDEGPVLALEGRLDAAVEEEGHVGVFFGLGDAQLGEALFGQILAHDMGEGLGLEGHLHVGHGDVVLGEADVVHRQAAQAALKAGEGVVDKGAGDLPRAVGAEVEEDHGVARRNPAALAGDGGDHELVGHAGGIAFFHDLHRAALVALAVYEGGVGLFHPVPAVVAVHGVVAAGDGGDFAHAQLGELLLELLDVALAGIGRDVAAVHDGVHVQLGGAQVLCQVQQAEQMLDVAVHAARGEKAHQMDGFAALDGGLHGPHNGLVFADGAILDGFGDAGELLVHDAARTDVGVAHLAVAHLAVGQANVHAGGADGGVGAGGEQTVQVGGAGGHNGVAVGLFGHPAEAVEDAEHERLFGHESHSFVENRARRPPQRAGGALKSRNGRGKLTCRPQPADESCQKQRPPPAFCAQAQNARAAPPFQSGTRCAALKRKACGEVICRPQPQWLQRRQP